MKKQRNYSQLEEQEKSPERTNNETDLTRLLDHKFKKEIIKMLKELRKMIDRNADHCNKELECRPLSMAQEKKICQSTIDFPSWQGYLSMV